MIRRPETSIELERNAFQHRMVVALASFHIVEGGSAGTRHPAGWLSAKLVRVAQVCRCSAGGTIIAAWQIFPVRAISTNRSTATIPARLASEFMLSCRPSVMTAASSVTISVFVAYLHFAQMEFARLITSCQYPRCPCVRRSASVQRTEKLALLSSADLPEALLTGQEHYIEWFFHPRRRRTRHADIFRTPSMNKQARLPDDRKSAWCAIIIAPSTRTSSRTSIGGRSSCEPRSSRSGAMSAHVAEHLRRDEAARRPSKAGSLPECLVITYRKNSPSLSRKNVGVLRPESS